MTGENVIGSGYVEIRPKTDGFEQEANKDLEGPAQRIATRLGNTVGTAVGKGIGLALNEKVQAAVGGVALLLQKFADDQTQAQQKLQSAIEATGGSISDYQTRIDAAVRSGEHLGLSQDKTKDRLTELTLALGDPKKALDELTLAENISAGTGRSFTSVIELLAKGQEGSATAYARLGVQVQNFTKVQKDLQTAEAQQASTTDKLAQARQSFNDKLAVYRQDTTHTLSQQQSLYDAYKKVQQAQEDHAAAVAKVVQAQNKARDAAKENGTALDQLGAKYKGQASAGADSFTGKVKEVTAEVKDSAGNIIAKYGNAAGGVGFALIGLSRVTSVVKDAFRSMRDVEVATSAEAAAAIETNAAAASAAMTAEADVAVATSGKISGLLGLIGKVGPAAVAAGGALTFINALASGKVTDTLNDHQTGLLRAIRDQSLGVKLPSSVNRADASALAGAGLDDLQQLDAYIRKGGTDAANLKGPLRDKVLAMLDQMIQAGTSAITSAQGNAFSGGVDSDNPNIATRAAQNAAAAGSKIGTAAGKATGDSFADFLKKYDLGAPVNAALAAAHDKAVGAAQKLVDDVSSKLDTAKSKLATDLASYRQEIATVAQTVTQGSSLTDALNGADSGARNPFGDRPGQGSGLHGVEGFLHTRAMMLARFAKALNDLRRRGLAPALIAEVANLGVDEGLRAADELLAGSAADIRTLNLEQQQINRAAGVIGTGIARQDYGSLIAADQANELRLERKLDELKRALARLSPGKVDVSVAQTGASAKEVGQEVGTAIRQAMKGMG